ncbi:hypothetical protein GGI24_006122, partial [Coemansia furcata]
MSTPSSQEPASAKRSRAESPEADAQQTKRKAEDATTKRAKNEEDGDEEQHHFLRESDVGITQFVTAGWDGFDAIIKHR